MNSNELVIREMKTRLGATVQLIYRPDGYSFFRYQAGVHGLDTFSYVIRQGNKEDKTTVTVNVIPRQPTGIGHMTIEEDFSILKH